MTNTDLLWLPPYLHDGYHAFVGYGVCPDGEVARGVSADNTVDGIPVGGVRLVPVHHRQICHHNLHSVLRNFSWILQIKDRSGHGGSFLLVLTATSPLPYISTPTGQSVPWRGPRGYTLWATHPFLPSGFLIFYLSIFPNLSKPSFTFQPEGEQTRYHLVTAQVSANARSKRAKNVPDILIQLQQSES